MGHERIGKLPRTQRWIQVVEELEGVADDPSRAVHVANQTLQNVRQRFERIEIDGGVAAALQYLIALGHAARSSSEKPPNLPDLSTDPSAARLSVFLSQWVDEHRDSLEYAEIAKQAASDAIAQWTRVDSPQEELFPRGVTAAARWGESANGSGFSEIARCFFARFTARYLRYFLDREASASVQTIEQRNRFDRDLGSAIEAVSRHAFETSKITQSFAAGWYNNHARDSLPSERAMRGFLRLAFQKIREELGREAAAE